MIKYVLAAALLGASFVPVLDVIEQKTEEKAEYYASF